MEQRKLEVAGVVTEAVDTLLKGILKDNKLLGGQQHVAGLVLSVHGHGGCAERAWKVQQNEPLGAQGGL